MSIPKLKNPFRPGAGHAPPYLAGRSEEKEEFLRLARQDIILENLVLTGLRGVGKTVLLDTFKPLSVQENLIWVGTDLSEASSLTEDNIATRLLTDLSVATSSIVVNRQEAKGMGFKPVPQIREIRLDYSLMITLYNNTPGLVSDKLKAVLEFAWSKLEKESCKGLVFAYDEAQNLADHSAKDQYPLSLLLDLFQSIQKKEIPFLLVLTGLPTLFPKLVEARTYSERMFRVVFLNSLNKSESREAITRPMENCPLVMTSESVELIIEQSAGYPYFIQYLCREAFDVFVRHPVGSAPPVPIADITRKLDTDFFAGRWARATDRQKDLLTVISHLDLPDREFTVQEIVNKSKSLDIDSFGSSQVNQMLTRLTDAGLIYKNRHGKYCFAVPLLGAFILRQGQ